MAGTPGAGKRESIHSDAIKKDVFTWFLMSSLRERSLD